MRPNISRFSRLSLCLTPVNSYFIIINKKRPKNVSTFLIGNLQKNPPTNRLLFESAYFWRVLYGKGVGSYIYNCIKKHSLKLSASSVSLFYSNLLTFSCLFGLLKYSKILGEFSEIQIKKGLCESMSNVAEFVRFKS
jgi:hypothetical protein